METKEVFSRRKMGSRVVIAAVLTGAIAGCRSDVEDVLSPSLQPSVDVRRDSEAISQTTNFKLGKFEGNFLGSGSVNIQPAPDQKATLEDFLQALREKFSGITVQQIEAGQREKNSFIRYRQLNSSPYTAQPLQIMGAEFTAHLDEDTHVTRVFGSMVPAINFPEAHKKLSDRLSTLPGEIQAKYPHSSFNSPGELVLISTTPFERFAPDSFRPAYRFISSPELHPGEDIRAPREVFVDAISLLEVEAQ